MSDLTRRDFLKLGGAGLLGLFVASGLPAAFPTARTPLLQGRVTAASIDLHAEPDGSSAVLASHPRDAVLRITEVLAGEDAEAYNRVWYCIDGTGYAYSGTLQPVETVLNAAVGTLPPGGQLGEVSVPFTDSHLNPEAAVARRLYYASTHWARELVSDGRGRPWYRIYDDLLRVHTFVLAEALRLISPEELAPLSPGVPPEEKRIAVDLTGQTVIAYEAERVVFSARASTGLLYHNGVSRTPAGHFTTYRKRPSRHMAAGDLAAGGYDLPGVPWVCYITSTGVSFHGTYWHNDYGTPHSHGCINMTPQAAKWLYRWTEPVVAADRQVISAERGTAVDIYP